MWIKAPDFIIALPMKDILRVRHLWGAQPNAFTVQGKVCLLSLSVAHRSVLLSISHVLCQTYPLRKAGTRYERSNVKRFRQCLSKVRVSWAHSKIHASQDWFAIGQQWHMFT